MKIPTIVLVMSFIATSAHAAVTSYDCSLHSMEAQGWIPDRVILSIDPEAKRARAYDGYIHHVQEEPKDVKFKTTRKGEYRLNWKLNVPVSDGGELYVSYTATLNPKTNKLNMIARFPQVNATNRPSGIGPCKIMKNESLYGS